LPEPVSAAITTSRPSRNTGAACDCTYVAVSNPSLFSDASTAGCASGKLANGTASGSAASAEAQAEALIAALDDADADAGLDAGARVVDVADFDRFATAEMKQEADDIIALMMKYENAPRASGSVSGERSNAHNETSSDDVAALLADAALEVVGAERLDEGDGELKELMKKLAGDLKAEKRKESTSSADGEDTRR